MCKHCLGNISKNPPVVVVVPSICCIFIRVGQAASRQTGNRHRDTDDIRPPVEGG